MRNLLLTQSMAEILRFHPQDHHFKENSNVAFANSQGTASRKSRCITWRSKNDSKFSMLDPSNGGASWILPVVMWKGRLWNGEIQSAEARRTSARPSRRGMRGSLTHWAGLIELSFTKTLRDHFRAKSWIKYFRYRFANSKTHLHLSLMRAD